MLLVVTILEGGQLWIQAQRRLIAQQRHSGEILLLNLDQSAVKLKL
jgi:hypothetical protein